MAKAEIPFTDQEVSTSDPTGSLMTIGMLIAGFAVFSMASDIGDNLGSRINSAIGEFIGTNPATGEETGDDLL